MGLAAGVATVGLVSLFTRGADVNIETGTQVEMVLQRPLMLEEENLAGVGPRDSAGTGARGQSAKADGQTPKHADFVPAGRLGCE